MALTLQYVGGVSRKKHLLDARRQMPGEDPDDLLPHEEKFPEEFAFLWSWFTELCGTRQSAVGMEQTLPQPIQFSEYEAWARLRGVDPTPWQLRALMKLDALAVTAILKG